MNQVLSRRVIIIIKKTTIPLLQYSTISLLFFHYREEYTKKKKLLFNYYSKALWVPRFIFATSAVKQAVSGRAGKCVCTIFFAFRLDINISSSRCHSLVLFIPIHYSFQALSYGGVRRFRQGETDIRLYFE